MFMCSILYIFIIHTLHIYVYTLLDWSITIKHSDNLVVKL